MNRWWNRRGQAARSIDATGRCPSDAVVSMRALGIGLAIAAITMVMFSSVTVAQTTQPASRQAPSLSKLRKMVANRGGETPSGSDLPDIGSIVAPTNGARPTTSVPANRSKRGAWRLATQAAKTTQPTSHTTAPTTAASTVKPSAVTTSDASTGVQKKIDELRWQSGDKMMFAFDGMSYKSVFDTIERASGLPIMGERNIPGTVSYFSEKEMTLDEAMAELNKILQGKAVLVRIGDSLRIDKFPEAKRLVNRDFLNAESFLNNPSVASNEIVRVVFKVNRLPANEVITLLAETLPVSEVNLAAWKASNRIQVTGLASVVREVIQMANKLDREIDLTDPGRVVKVFHPRYIKAIALSNGLKELLPQEDVVGPDNMPMGEAVLQSTRRDQASRVPSKAVSIVADDKSNAVVVRAPQGLMEYVTKLVALIDVQGENRKFTLLPLKNAKAMDIVTKILLPYYKGDRDAQRVVADAASNTLVTWAENDELAELRALVTELDRAAGEGLSMPEVRGYLMNDADLGVIVTTLKEIFKDVPGVVFQADRTTGMLYVAAPSEQQERISSAVKNLQSSPTDQSSTRVVSLKFADANQAAAAVRQAFTGRKPKPGVQPFQVAVNAESNGVVLSGDKASLEEAAALLDQLDDDVRTSAEVRTFRLKVAQASDIAKMINDLYGSKAPGKLRVVTDTWSNTVFVAGAGASLEGITKLVAEADQTEPTTSQASEPNVVQIPLKHAAPIDVAYQISSIITPVSSGPAKAGGDAGLPTIDAATTGNYLIVSGQPKQIDRVRELAKQFDDMAADTPERFDVKPIQKIRAERLAQMLEMLLPELTGAEVQVAKIEIGQEKVDLRQLMQSKPSTGDKPRVVLGVDVVNNNLMVRAQPREMDSITELITKLTADLDGDVDFRIHVLKNANPIEVCASIEALFNEGVSAATQQNQQGGRGRRNGNPQGPQPPQPQAQPQPQPGQPQQGQPQPQPARRRVRAIAMQSMNAVVVRAEPRDFTTVADLIQQLDSPQPGSIEIFRLTKASADAVAKNINEVYRGKGGADVVATADLGSNSVFVSSPKSELQSVQQIITVMDQAGQTDSGLHIVPLKTGDAAKLAPTIQTLVMRAEEARAIQLNGKPEPVAINADPATNVLIVAGSARVQKEVEALVAQLEGVRPGSGTRRPWVIPLKNIDPKGAKQLLEQLIPQSRSDAGWPVPTGAPSFNSMRMGIGAARWMTMLATASLPVAEASNASSATKKLAANDPNRADVRQRLMTMIKESRRTRTSTQSATTKPVEEKESAHAAGKSAIDPSAKSSATTQPVGQGAEKVRPVGGGRGPNPAELIRRQLAEEAAGASREKKDNKDNRDNRENASAQATKTDRAERPMGPPPAEMTRHDGAAPGGGPGEQAALQALLKQMVENRRQTSTQPTSASTQIRGTTTQPGDRISDGAAVDLQKLAGQIQGKVEINELSDQGALIVYADEEDFRVVEKMLKTLDLAMPRPEVKLVRLTNIRAADMEKLLSRLYGQRQQPKGLPTSFTSEPVSNSLIVQASSELMPEIEKIIAQIDGNEQIMDMQFLTFPLENARASQVASQLEQMIQQLLASRSMDKLPMTINADERTNTLIVTAPPTYTKQIEQIVALLDSVPGFATVRMEIVRLKCADAPTLAGLLNGLLSSQPATKGSNPADMFRRWGWMPSEALDMVQNDKSKSASIFRRLKLVSEKEGKEFLLDLDRPAMILPDKSTQSLAILATDENIVAIKQLIDVYDRVPIAEDVTVRVFPLAHADSTDLIKTLDDVFKNGEALTEVPGVGRKDGVPTNAVGQALVYKMSFAADARTNSVIVSGREAGVALAEVLISKLDQDKPEELYPIRMVGLDYADAATVGKLIQEMMDQRQKHAKDLGMGKAAERMQVVVRSDERSNRLLICASDADYQTVAELVKKLDTANAAGFQPVFVPLKNIDPIEAAKLAEEVLKAQASLRKDSNQGGGVQPQVVPDTRSNSLIVLASAQGLDEVKKLLAELDQPADPSRQVRVFALKRAKADSVRKIIDDIYTKRRDAGVKNGAIFVTIDERSNAVVAAAGVDDLQAISAIVERLDSADITRKMELAVIPLASADASELAKAIDDVMSPGSGEKGLKESVIMEFIERTPEGQTLTRQAIKDQMFVYADKNTNMLIVMAPSDVVGLVKSMVTYIDQVAPSVGMEFFELKNADATKMKDTIEELLELGKKSASSSTMEMSASNITSFTGESSSATKLDKQMITVTADARTNTLIVTGTPTYIKLIGEIVKQLDAKEVQEHRTEVISLSNAKAESVEKTVSKLVENRSKVLEQAYGKDGIAPERLMEHEINLVADEDTQKIILSASSRYFDEIRSIIKELDATPPQVMIQALLVEITLDERMEWGFEMVGQDLSFTKASKGTGIGPGEDIVVGSALGTEGTGVAGFNFVLRGEDLNLLLRAMNSDSRLSVLSRPQITARDNAEATITIGQEVPIPSAVIASGDTGNTSTQVNYRDVALELKVKPHINPDNYVNMEVETKIETISGSTVQITEGLSASVFNKRNTKTEVSIMDGETVIIGGLITSKVDRTENKVPFLGDIPGVGNFFRSVIDQDSQTELLVILTPHVIRGPDDAKRLSQKERDFTELLPDAVRTSEFMGSLRVDPSEITPKTQEDLIKKDMNRKFKRLFETPCSREELQGLPMNDSANPMR